MSKNNFNKHTIRALILPVNPLLNKLKTAKNKNTHEYVYIDNIRIKVTSQRYAVFQKSVTCCTCGVKGIFFAAEKSATPMFDNYHLNLYGIKNGKEVLLTKDHIKPKSKGGKDILSNYRTMCAPCNSRRGNKEL